MPDHEKDDAVRVGEMELVEAASRFDPRLGTKFQSYAKNCIWCVIKRWSAGRRLDRIEQYVDVADYRNVPVVGELVELVDRLKSDLDSRWWNAISLTYGICDGVPKSHSEVASIMGVNKSVVGFFVQRGMDQMRKTASRMEVSYDW